MDEKASSSHFQQVIEAVETLPLDDQALLIDIVQQRLSPKPRSMSRTRGEDLTC